MGNLGRAALVTVLSVGALGAGVQDSAAAGSCGDLPPNTQPKEGKCYTAASFMSVVIQQKGYWTLAQGFRTVSEMGGADRTVKSTLLVNTAPLNGQREALEVETPFELDRGGKLIPPKEVTVVKVIDRATTFPSGPQLYPSDMLQDGGLTANAYCGQFSNTVLKSGETGANTCGYAPDVATKRLKDGQLYVLAGDGTMSDAQGVTQEVYLQYVFATESIVVGSYVIPPVGVVMSNHAARDYALTKQAEFLRFMESRRVAQQPTLGLGGN